LGKSRVWEANSGNMRGKNEEFKEQKMKIRVEEMGMEMEKMG